MVGERVDYSRLVLYSPVSPLYITIRHAPVKREGVLYGSIFKKSGSLKEAYIFTIKSCFLQFGLFLISIIY